MKRNSVRLHLEHLEDRIVPSSAGDIEWLRQFGSYSTPNQLLDPAEAVAGDGNGNIYVVGEGLPPLSLATPGDVYVRKYDASGTEIWTRQFDAFGVSCIAVDASGVYVAGYTYRALPGQTSAGDYDAFVRKYDADGNELWTRQFGTAYFDGATSIAVDASGVYVAGQTEVALPGQTSAGSADAFVRKYDDDGNELWTRQFGSTGDDLVAGVAVDASGVYVAGSTYGALPGQTSAGSVDAFVRKYDDDGNELWTRQFGNYDQANSVAVDASGVYVAGYTVGTLPGQTSAGSADAFVRKYDDDGNELWTRQFGSSNVDQANSVAVDASGVYVAGWLDGTGEPPGHADSDMDAFVRKYDASGAEVWTRQFGGSNDDGALGVAVDAAGVYVAGFTTGSLPGSDPGLPLVMDSFVRKYDGGGTEVWTHQFGDRIPVDDAARAVDADGNVYVAGGLGGVLLGQTDGGGAFVRKYDAAGNVLWTRQFGTFRDEAIDEAIGIAVDTSGVYVCGITVPPFGSQTSAGAQDAFLRKYDANGNELWASEFGTSGTDSADGIAVDGTGVYITGSTTGAFPGEISAGGQDAFVRKYDTAGNALWTHQFGTASTDQATGVAADGSGVYVSGFTGGTFAGQASAGGQDAFVRKYDANGNVLWISQFGAAGADQASGIAVDVSGVYVSGFTTGTLAGLTSAGLTDAFLRKYDAGGAELWTRQFGTAGVDQATGVAVGPAGVYVAGLVGGALPGHTSAGAQDAFVRKYDFSGTELWTGQFGTDAADSAVGIAVSASGLYVAGTTSGRFPGQTNTSIFPNDDVFVAKIVDNGTFTSLSSSDSASVFGESVTITASVAATSGGLGIPSGTVQFRVDGSDFGSPETLVNGIASISTAGLSVGPHTISADYSGDDLFAASTSDVLNQVVNQASTATVVSVSAPTPLFRSDGLTISATISVVAPGSGDPTGTVTFYDSTSILGTADLVAGAASLALGNTALGAGPHTIRAVYSGDGSFASSDSTAAVNVLAPSTIQGLVYVDTNNNGQVDFGETAIPGVTVTLTGIDDLGHAVSRTDQTDANGVYAFINLRPSNAAGYAITETQPAGFLDGQDTLGTVNGAPVGSNSINDSFSGIVLSQGGLLAENYNFGELPSPSGGVGAGQTAGIGFWQNRNGQSLILALNGSATATQLGHWLATTFPNMYAALDGMTNAQVAAYYKILFARTAQTAPGGPPKVDAQVLATAFAVYVTNQTLAGMTAAAFGFEVTATGVGTQTFNVGNNGAAFGVANNSSLSVMDLLLAVNARAHNGLLYDMNGNGQISGSEASLRTMANDVFAAINEAGDI